MLEYIVGYIGIAFIHFILSLIVIYFITKPTFKYCKDLVCFIMYMSGCDFSITVKQKRITLTSMSFLLSTIWPFGLPVEIIIFILAIVFIVYEYIEKITTNLYEWFWDKL